MAMLTAKLTSPPAATTWLPGGGRRSAPPRRATVIRAAAVSYADELVSTAVSPHQTLPHLPRFHRTCCSRSQSPLKGSMLWRLLVSHVPIYDGAVRVCVGI